MGWASRHIEKLNNGANEVSFRPKGNSMVPIVKSGQLVTVSRVTKDTVISKGDVVLCKVSGRQFLHKVTAIKNEGTDNAQYQISNNKGHVNGWICRKTIYGKMI